MFHVLININADNSIILLIKTESNKELHMKLNNTNGIKINMDRTKFVFRVVLNLNKLVWFCTSKVQNNLDKNRNCEWKIHVQTSNL